MIPAGSIQNGRLHQQRDHEVKTYEQVNVKRLRQNFLAMEEGKERQTKGLHVLIRLKYEIEIIAMKLNGQGH